MKVDEILQECANAEKRRKLKKFQQQLNETGAIKSRSTMNIKDDEMMDVPRMGINEFNWHQDDLIENMVTLDKQVRIRINMNHQMVKNDLEQWEEHLDKLRLRGISDVEFLEVMPKPEAIKNPIMRLTKILTRIDVKYESFMDPQRQFLTNDAFVRMQRQMEEITD